MNLIGHFQSSPRLLTHPTPCSRLRFATSITTTLFPVFKYSLIPLQSHISSSHLKESYQPRPKSSQNLILARHDRLQHPRLPLARPPNPQFPRLKRIHLQRSHHKNLLPPHLSLSSRPPRKHCLSFHRRGGLCRRLSSLQTLSS